MKQIISPHIDDAVFSMGGSICKWLSEGENIKVIYIFTSSDWTNPQSISGRKYPKDITTITSLRKLEEKVIQKILGHDAKFLDWKEAGLRGKKSMLVDFLLHGSIPMTENRMTKKIKEQLKYSLDCYSTTLFPLGLGKWRHPDHVITRKIGLSLWKEGFNVAMYDDLPYCTHINKESINGRFFDGLEFKPVYEEINIEKKIQLLECYQSQMSPEWLKIAHDYSFTLQNNKAHERYWIPC